MNDNGKLSLVEHGNIRILFSLKNQDGTVLETSFNEMYITRNLTIQLELRAKEISINAQKFYVSF